MDKLIKIVLVFSIINIMLCTVMIAVLIYKINTRYDSSIETMVPTAELAETIGEELIAAHYNKEVKAEAVDESFKWVVTATDESNSSYYNVVIKKSDGKVLELKYCEE